MLSKNVSMNISAEYHYALAIYKVLVALSKTLDDIKFRNWEHIYFRSSFLLPVSSLFFLWRFRFSLTRVWLEYRPTLKSTRIIIMRLAHGGPTNKLSLGAAVSRGFIACSVNSEKSSTSAYTIWIYFIWLFIVDPVCSN